MTENISIVLTIYIYLCDSNLNSEKLFKVIIILIIISLIIATLIRIKITLSEHTLYLKRIWLKSSKIRLSSDSMRAVVRNSISKIRINIVRWNTIDQSETTCTSSNNCTNHLLQNLITFSPLKATCQIRCQFSFTPVLLRTRCVQLDN